MIAKTSEAQRSSFDVSVPDVLLPEQYFDRLAVRSSDTPERRLLFAVLLDAVIQLQRRNTSTAAEAERWIRNESRPELPFSFRNVCEALGVEPGYLRRGLLAWRRSELGAMPGIPVRQLRTSHRRVTPLGRRRRRRAATAAATQSAGAMS
ncbi:MAG: hypothetical protein B6D46_15575 [Polyangiaceae bacterium UTPRO1]|jgi:hypothetical protein|nr:hypothetical protein [Myxococcales bacterium]OQY64876.1 MAG: hypothetical protein B6D46_15575 [Polyangiaceae bacterium UTPRO1]